MPHLPLTPAELQGPADIILIIPEAYVDHPSFGHAVISRLLEAEGFAVAILSQPQNNNDYMKFGEPKYAFMVSGGVVDSMVNNYTVAKNKRTKDEYSEGGRAGRRPDRAVSVYTKNLKRLFPGIPVIIGGIETSLRRFAHYDYWADAVLPSILADSGADLLVYGMGERPLWEISSRLKDKGRDADLSGIPGTARIIKSTDGLPDGFIECPSFEEVKSDKIQYVKAFNLQFKNSNAISGKGLYQRHGKDAVVIEYPPALPLIQEEMDKVYALPFTGLPHPSYQDGVPAIEEVRFSITSHRGCFGACSFCALSYHQGRAVSHRSKGSILTEAEKLTKQPDFKGYIHDVGGPTANFRNPSCQKQIKSGVCPDRMCIGYTPCPNLTVDHSDYLDILEAVKRVPGVKKVFIRSGIRYDYLMMEKNPAFFKNLVADHVSGQLKVAPEHSADFVLKLMNKPPFAVYKKFADRFRAENERIGKEQYLVPYLISSHPGCTLKSAVELTEYLKSIGYMPEQVQDFYPTPSTKSTCMYYTGIDPDTMKPIYVARTKEEKRMQRALLQYRLKENASVVNEAYRLAGPASAKLIRPPRYHDTHKRKG